jgi:hypothetical protein
MIDVADGAKKQSYNRAERLRESVQRRPDLGYLSEFFQLKAYAGLHQLKARVPVLFSHAETRSKTSSAFYKYPEAK